MRDWQKRRSEFNHDHLKNEYIPDLGAWLNLLNGKIKNPAMEESFVDSGLPVWVSFYQEASALSADFEIEMSPRTLFNDTPLSNCDEDTKAWLGTLIHQLWLERYSVRKLIVDVSRSAQITNDTYIELQDALKNCKDTKKAEALKPYKDLFSELLKNCRFLAEAIENFPSEVKAV